MGGVAVDGVHAQWGTLSTSFGSREISGNPIDMQMEQALRYFVSGEVGFSLAERRGSMEPPETWGGGFGKRGQLTRPAIS